MLIHKLKPGESIYIRGEIEIKNLTNNSTKLGCIGDGEVSTDGAPAPDAEASSGCAYFDLKIDCPKALCAVCKPLVVTV